MAHFAKLNNNEVIDIVVVNNNELIVDDIEIEEIGVNFLISLFNHPYWKQTSYNTRGGIHYLPDSNTPSSTQEKAIRWAYAKIGMIYEPLRDIFIHKKPYPSWNLNEETYTWESPISIPNKDFIPTEFKAYNHYIWNEDILNWELIKPFRSWLPIGTPSVSYYISPVPYPTDGVSYRWNEHILNWNLID